MVISRNQTGVYARLTELRWLIAVTFVLWGMFLWTERGLSGADFNLVWSDFVWFGTLQRYTVALFVAHFLLNWRQPNADQKLLPLVGIVGGFSLLLMYRLPTPYWDSEIGQFRYAIQQSYYIGRQALFLLLGLTTMLVVTLIPWDISKVLQKYRWLILFFGLALLVLTILFGIGSSDGATVSLNLRFFQLQPSELIKLCVVIFLASYLAENQRNLEQFTYRYFNLPLPRFVNYLPSMGIVLAAVLIFLVFMSDLGVALILLGLFPIMVYVALPAEVSRRLIMMSAIVVLVGYFFLVQMGVSPMATLETANLTELPANSNLPAPVEAGLQRVTSRLQMWQDPWGNCTAQNGCQSYQALQALYTISAGGLLGLGPGQAPTGQIIIPFVHTDMVFAGFVADWGLLGGLLLLLVYFAFLKRGLLIAQSQSTYDPFNSLLAVGITSLFALQLFVILGGTLNLLPLTGITVPFLSYGGTSILVNSFMVGLLLRLSTNHTTQARRTHIPANIARVSHIFRILIGLLAFALFYWTVFKASALHPAFPQFDETSQNPVAQQWQANWLERVTRGNIWSADGKLLVTNGTQGREYHQQALPLVHVLGQVNGVGVGVSGLESAYNDILLGRGRYDLATMWARQFDGNWSGNDLTLTIDATLQQVASNALGDYLGSVVLLDAETGAVLAMVSHPLYNPHEAVAVEHNITSPLLNRAIQGLYPPGSTFKTVTAAGALQNDLTTPETSYDFRTDQWETSADGSTWCHYQQWGSATIPSCNTDKQVMSLSEGFAWSDNILFAQLANELGGIRLWNTATSFGFHQSVPFDLPTAQSHVATDVTQLEDPAQLAMSGFGQSEVTVTPLQMALVAAAIGNRQGDVPKPYLIDQWLRPDGTTLQKTSPRTWIPNAIDRQQADALAMMMIQTVEDGWGYRAQVDGLVVGGKTGTAEWERTPYGAPPHSWFIGFVDLPDGRTLAIAVIAEGAGEGSNVASGIARQVFSATQ